MIETKEKVIGDVTYAVTQLPARRSLKLKAKLIKLFGPALTQLLLTSQDKQEKKPEEMSDEERKEADGIDAVDKVRINELRKASLVKGVQLLAEKLDDKTYDELIMELLQGVRRNGAELNSALVDTCFAGQLATLYQVIWFVIEVNYADFFPSSGTGNPLGEILSPQAQDTKKTYTFK